MDALYFLLPIFLIVLIVILITWISIRFGKKRTRFLKQIASSLNLKYDENAIDVTTKLLSAFSLFSNGYYHSASNVMTGNFEEIDVIISDFQYRVSHRITHSHTVIVVMSDLLKLPSFNIQPENLAHKINLSLGYQKIDIDFDSYPIFSKQNLLRGPDEKAVRDLFSPEVITYFEQHKNLCAEGAENVLLVFKHNITIRPEDFRSYLDEALGLYALMKRK